MRWITSIKHFRYFHFHVKIVPVLFLTAVFSISSCLSVYATFTLLYSTIYMHFTKLLLFPCKILTLFLLIFEDECTALFLWRYQLLQKLLEILFNILLMYQYLKLFVCLSQLQLVSNYLWNTHNLTKNLLSNHHLALLILFLLHHTVLLSH